MQKPTMSPRRTFFRVEAAASGNSTMCATELEKHKKNRNYEKIFKIIHRGSRLAAGGNSTIFTNISLML